MSGTTWSGSSCWSGKNQKVEPAEISGDYLCKVQRVVVECRIQNKPHGTARPGLQPAVRGDALAARADRRAQLPLSRVREGETRELVKYDQCAGSNAQQGMRTPRATLTELPDANKLVAFDRNRGVMVTMATNIEKAIRPQLAELVQLLVERVQAKGRSVKKPQRGASVHRVDLTCSPIL